MKFKDFSNKIITLKNEDVALRNFLIKQRKLNDTYNEEMEKLHINNANKLDKIIKEIGYPTI